MSSTSSKLVFGSILVGASIVLCIAIVAQAQYNTYDSDSNSDSEGSPILTQSELGKLVRNSARAQNQQRYNQQQLAAATRNLYNKQQPMQFAPTQHRRNYGSSEGNGYGPVMGASAATGRGSNANSDDDDEGPSAFGPNFGSNFDNGNSNDDGEGSSANGDGPALNLNQAASGYPGQGDYSEGAGAGFGFGGSSGYSPADGSDFGPSEGFGSEGRRAKSASSPLSSRNFGSDDDAGAPQYGPNSAINGGGSDDDEGRAGYAPEGQGDNENDDE